MYQDGRQGSVHPRRSSRMGRSEGRARRHTISDKGRHLGGVCGADHPAGRPSCRGRHALINDVDNNDDHNNVVFKGRRMVEEGCDAPSTSPA